MPYLEHLNPDVLDLAQVQKIDKISMIQRDSVQSDYTDQFYIKKTFD